jgi:hypothetical protein
VRTEEQITADARPGAAFSNGSSWEIWQANWCARGRGCVNDEDGGGPTGTYCPLITVAMVSDPRVTPAEWVEGDGIQDYACTEFEEAGRGGGDEPPPEPQPEVDGQLDIVDAYLDTAIGELSKAPEGVRS